MALIRGHRHHLGLDPPTQRQHQRPSVRSSTRRGSPSSGAVPAAGLSALDGLRINVLRPGLADRVPSSGRSPSPPSGRCRASS
jgi:hypothetical protein